MKFKVQLLHYQTEPDAMQLSVLQRNTDAIAGSTLLLHNCCHPHLLTHSTACDASRDSQQAACACLNSIVHPDAAQPSGMLRNTPLLQVPQ